MKGTELGIWVDEYDLSYATSQIDLTFEIAEAEETNLDSAAQEFSPVLSAVKVAQNGFFRGVLPDGFEAELHARFAAGAAIVTVLTQRSDADCVAYVLPGAVDYEMTFATPVNSLVTLNGRWGSSAVVQRGRRVYDGTLGATGEQAAVDFGAGVLDGGMAFLHVASVTGVAVDVDVEVQSSADNNTWVDEGTFTFSDPGGYSLDLTGTIGRYVRLNCTDLGGASGIRCMAVVSLG